MPAHPLTPRWLTCSSQADEGECNWAGPSWPYETSRVLSGLANLLNDYGGAADAAAGGGGDTHTEGRAPGELGGMTSQHYMQLLKQYAVSMTRSHPANSSLPYIGENIEPDQGFWQARSAPAMLSLFYRAPLSVPMGCHFCHYGGRAG